MLVSSGDANRPFSVLDMVFGFASSNGGCQAKSSTEDVYEKALDRLIESAVEMEADGVLFVGFQNRVATAAGCFGPQQVFEVFAWGTAVRWTKNP